MKSCEEFKKETYAANILPESSLIALQTGWDACLAEAVKAVEALEVIYGLQSNRAFLERTDVLAALKGGKE